MMPVHALRTPAQVRVIRRVAAASPLAAAVFAMVAVVAVGDVQLDTASQTASATATVTVDPVAKLTLSAASLAFDDADPDNTPTILAKAGAITITCKARATFGATVTLVVQAVDDLRSGLDTILATQVSWTATGMGFVDGTVSKTAAQPVGSWVGSGLWTGTQLYRLANSWDYPTGTYTTTLTYTMTAP